MRRLISCLLAVVAGGGASAGEAPVFTAAEVAAYRPKGPSKCFRQICLEYNTATRAKSRFSPEELAVFFSNADPERRVTSAAQ